MSNPDPTSTQVVIAKTPATVQRPTTLETPEGQPDLTIVPVHPAKIIAIRAIRAYMTCFQGLFAAGITPLDQGVLPADLWDLLWAIAGLSIGAAVASVINNTTELFTTLANKYPIMRA
jgi:hypothetical protein